MYKLLVQSLYKRRPGYALQVTGIFPYDAGLCVSPVHLYFPLAKRNMQFKYYTSPHHLNRLLRANLAWFLDQSFLYCLFGPKEVQTISFHNLCILFLLMKQGILTSCLGVRSSPRRKAPCWFFWRSMWPHRPVSPYLLQHPCMTSSASCNHSTCAVVHDFKYLQVS